MKVVETDEIVHIIERRLFPDDVRRHFVGKVEAASKGCIRLRGFLFVYDTSASTFLRKPELRTRLFRLDNRIIVNVLPREVSVEEVRYSRDEEGNLSLTDGRELDLDVSEFSSRE